MLYQILVFKNNVGEDDDIKEGALFLREKGLVGKFKWNDKFFLLKGNGRLFCYKKVYHRNQNEFIISSQDFSQKRGGATPQKIWSLHKTATLKHGNNVESINLTEIPNKDCGFQIIVEKEALTFCAPNM